MKRTGLLSVAVATAFLTSTSATPQPLLPISAVGYLNVDIEPGYNLVGVTLKNETIKVSEIFERAPAGTSFFFFDDGEFVEVFGVSELTLNVGDAMLVHNPGEAFTATFAGEVPQGTLVTSLPEGLSLLSPMIPMEASLEALGFQPMEDDQVFIFDRAAGRYRTSMYLAGLGRWHPAPPVLQAGEAFFLRTSYPREWVLEFSLNQ